MRIRRTAVLAVIALVVPFTGVVASTAAPAAPTVTSLAPDRGNGSAVLAVSGTGFASDSTVQFDSTVQVTSTPAASVQVRSSTLIYAGTPTLNAGVYDIRVTSAGAQSAITTTDHYTVVPSPAGAQSATSLGFLGGLQSCTAGGLCFEFGQDTYVTFQDGVRQARNSVPEKMHLAQCLSATFCATVGDEHAYVFDGTHWTAFQHLNADALSCASPTACIALGENGAWWRWDGTTWIGRTDGPAHGPNRYGEQDFGLSCPTTSFCAAALSAHPDEDSPSSRLYTYDGTSWSVAARRPYGDVTETQLSCSSPSYCFGVVAGGLATSHGSGWALDSGPEWRQLPYLRCFGTNDCLAEAHEPRHSAEAALESWNGSAWTVLADVPETEENGPAEVDCGTETACMLSITLDFVRWWTAGSGFGPPRELGDQLYNESDASCPAARPWCMAVSVTGRVGIFDDGDWQPAQPVDTAATPAAISCLPSESCLIVDDIGSAVWVSPTGAVQSRTSVDPFALVDVSCAAGPVCVAIDVAGRVVRYQDGEWHRPTAYTPDRELLQVSCTSTTFCMAVGHGYVIRYRGHGRWTAAKRIGTYAGLVSCTSSSFCLVGAKTGIRFWGSQAFSPVHEWSGSRNVIALDCATKQWCLTSSLSAADPNFRHTQAFDGFARGLAFVPGALDFACWAPAKCLTFEGSDLVSVTGALH